MCEVATGVGIIPLVHNKDFKYFACSVALMINGANGAR